MRSRHIKRFYAAIFTKQVFGCIGIKFVSSQVFFAFYKPESVVGNDEVKITGFTAN